MIDDKILEDLRDIILSEEEIQKTKQRAWTTILYPESMQPRWQELLDELHIEWCASPLHDRDLNATGELKKPHVHLMIVAAGPTTYNQAKKILVDLIQGVAPIPVHSVRSATRYWAHLDNPDKAQYDPCKIISGGGFDLEGNLEKSKSYYSKLSKEITNFVKKNNITEYMDLLEYCELHDADSYDPDWYQCVVENYREHFKLLINSMRHKQQGTQLEKAIKDATNVAPFQTSFVYNIFVNH